MAHNMVCPSLSLAKCKIHLGKYLLFTHQNKQAMKKIRSGVIISNKFIWDKIVIKI